MVGIFKPYLKNDVLSARIGCVLYEDIVLNFLRKYKIVTAIMLFVFQFLILYKNQQP